MESSLVTLGKIEKAFPRYCSCGKAYAVSSSFKASPRFFLYRRVTSEVYEANGLPAQSTPSLSPPSTNYLPRGLTPGTNETAPRPAHQTKHTPHDLTPFAPYSLRCFSSPDSKDDQNSLYTIPAKATHSWPSPRTLETAPRNLDEDSVLVQKLPKERQQDFPLHKLTSLA